MDINPKMDPKSCLIRNDFAKNLSDFHAVWPVFYENWWTGQNKVKNIVQKSRKTGQFFMKFIESNQISNEYQYKICPIIQRLSLKFCPIYFFFKHIFMV